MLVWSGKAKWVGVGLPARARARRQWRVAEKRKGDRGRATAGVLVLFIGERASRRSQWRLGEVELAETRSAVAGVGGAAHGGRRVASPGGLGRVASGGKAI